MSVKYSEIEQKIVDAFMKLLEHLSPKDAVLTLDYWIFVKYSHEFHNLTEEEQMEARKVILALKLVHV